MKTTKFFSVLVFYTFVVFFFTSCTKKDEPVLPLSIVSITPADNETNVSLNPIITITFNKALDYTTLNDGIGLFDSKGIEIPTTGNVSGETVSFTSTTLLSGEKYVIKVSGVKSRDGVVIKDFKSTFTVKTVYLKILEISPKNNDTEISTNTKLHISFYSKVDESTLGGVKLFDSKGVQIPLEIYLAVAVFFDFVPANKVLLEAGEKYTIKISGVKGVDGHSVKDTTSTFTTRPVPLTVSTIPGVSATMVPLDSKITLVFSKKMKSNVVDQLFLSDYNKIIRYPITAIFDGDRTVIITPIGGLLKDTLYSIVYGSALASLDGEIFVDPYYGSNCFLTVIK